MKYLRLFESNNARDLVSQLDDSYIDDYFRSNYEANAQELAQYYNNIWQFVDDERFVDDWIDDDVNGTCLSDFDTDELKEYIKDELIDNEAVIKYLDKIRFKNGLDPDLDYEDILDELTKAKLKKIIEDQNSEEDCIRKRCEYRYSGMDTEDILSEIYGEKDLRENVYKYVQNYLDEDAMVEDYYDNEDFDFKSDFVENEIQGDDRLQRKLLKLNSDNADLLFNVMDKNSNLGKEYKFQDKFMKYQIKDSFESFEDEKAKDFICKKMKKLFDKFGLAAGIEEKYKAYTYYIEIEKYNL